MQQHKKDERTAYIANKQLFEFAQQPGRDEIKEATYKKQKEYGGETIEDDVIFLDKNGKQIFDVDIIKQNYDGFSSINLYKQNKDNPGVYESFDKKKYDDVHNNCEIFLANRNNQLEIK